MYFFKQLENIFVLENQSVDESQKRTFIVFVILITIPIIFVLTIDDFINKRILEGLFVLGTIIIFVSTLFTLKHIKKIDNILRVNSVLILSLLCYGLSVGGGHEHSFLWYYFFPICAFYVFKKKEGLIWVGLSILLSGFFFLSPFFHSYGIGVSIRFLFTYIIVAIISFGLESSRSKYHKDLLNKKKQVTYTNHLLDKANRNLVKENKQHKLTEREKERKIVQLQQALIEIKTLQGLLPICSSCKKIRDDKGYWNQIEGYIQKHSDAKFSHGLCPECSDKIYGEETWYSEVKKKRKGRE